MSQVPNSNLFTNPAKVRTAGVCYGCWYSAAVDMGHSFYGTDLSPTVHGVFTTPDAVCGDILVSLIGLSSETMYIYMSADGTNYSAALLPIDDVTGLDTTAAELTAGRYRFPILRFGSPKKLKFVKSSTSELVVVVAEVPYNAISF
jgi:hypothetical protein